MPLTTYGAQVAGQALTFGLLLPWVNPANGQSVSVKVIHENDQFIQSVPPIVTTLNHTVDPTYGDFWSGRVDLTTGAPPNSSWGKTGRYLYRFCISRPGGIPDIDWIGDPFAQAHGAGKISAIPFPPSPHAWSAAEANWRTPTLTDLVVYELNLAEFAHGIDQAVSRIPYLADLGVNCIEIMPVTDVDPEVDWGYLPNGYFGVDERLGDAEQLQEFIDQAHQHGLAVVLDVVYGHTGNNFPYYYAYQQLDYTNNPFMGSFGAHQFGNSINYNLQFPQDYFYTANNYWLDQFHVDGFRYDDVPDFWDGPTGKGYADLVYETYQFVATSQGAGPYWARFRNGGQVNLIQCAEKLDDPAGILYQSYSNSSWQDATLAAAGDRAAGRVTNPGTLGLDLALVGYPEQVGRGADAAAVTMPTTAVQYLENHDHPRFLNNFGTINPDADPLFSQGNRTLWYELQPYLIALLTAPGIPLLFQGQEFGENYTLPGWGLGRTLLLRPVRWEYFYDTPGQSLVHLVRALLQIRKTFPQFRGGPTDFYNVAYYTDPGLVVFSRGTGNQFSIVAVNLTDVAVTTTLTFPQSGIYKEQLSRALGYANPQDLNATSSSATAVQVPSNYGAVWTP
jgi:maltooligosyltrehalose trehalohydrolase